MFQELVNKFLGHNDEMKCLEVPLMDEPQLPKKADMWDWGDNAYRKAEAVIQYVSAYCIPGKNE